MYTIKYLENWVAEKKLPKYRAKQIYQAITKELVSDWHEANGLPKDLQSILVEELPISTLKIKVQLEAKNQDSIKIAFETEDNKIIESVLMRHDGERNTVCVSTQIGCPMNCAFCATGKMGFIRNLTAEEMVDQVLEFARLLNAEPYTPNPGNVNSVVFMGMGEPFLNYENVMEAIKILNDNQGFNLGHRHMTISTAGIVPGILRFAEEDVQVNLAISLHAPNDEIRNSIMPVSKQYPLEKLLPAVSEYMGKTNRKVFFEYILLHGINDSDANIQELIDLMRQYFPGQFNLVHINLIEYNETEEKDLKSPDKERVQKVFDILQKNKILTTIRHKFGEDISAACGQLAGK